jgi:hypothetical protein
MTPMALTVTLLTLLTHLMASMPSWTVKVSSWWSVLRKSATFLAAARSGEPWSPMQKECSLPHTPPADPKCLEAIEATKEESRPPDKRTPKGTSDMSLFTTAVSNDVLRIVKSRGADGNLSGCASKSR